MLNNEQVYIWCTYLSRINWVLHQKRKLLESLKYRSNLLFVARWKGSVIIFENSFNMESSKSESTPKQAMVYICGGMIKKIDYNF